MSTDTLNIAHLADELQKVVAEIPQVVEWLQPIPEGTDYESGAWFNKAIDPVNVQYNTKDLQIGLGIFTKESEVRVVIIFPFRSWKYGLNRVQAQAAIEKAIKLCDFCWNNHIITPEVGTTRVSVQIEA